LIDTPESFAVDSHPQQLAEEAVTNQFARVAKRVGLKRVTYDRRYNS